MKIEDSKTKVKLLRQAEDLKLQLKQELIETDKEIARS